VIASVLATGAAFAGLGGLVAAGGLLRLRELAATPTRTCGTVVPGETCQLQARAQTLTPLVAPLSGTSCAAYRVEFAQRARRFDGRWRVEGRIESGGEWWLEDESGKLPLDAAGAELGFPPTSVRYDPSDPTIDANPAFQELLRQAGLDERPNLPWVLTERCVPIPRPDGAVIFARGSVQPGPVLAGGRDLFLCLPGEEVRALRRERLTALAGAGLGLAGLAVAVVGALAAG